MGSYGMQAKTYSSIIKTTGTQNTVVGNNPMNCSAYKIQLELKTQQ